MPIRSALKVLASGLAAAMTAPAHALDPAQFGQGALKFTPTLDVTTGYDDNFRADPADDSSWITTIRPNLSLSAEQGANRYAASYWIARTLVHQDSDENTTNQALDLNADLEFDARNRLAFRAFWNRTEEVTSVGDPSDEYSNVGIDTTYGFGVSGAPINADFGYRFDRKRSENEANLENERDANEVRATLYLATGPRAQALAEIRYREADFRFAPGKDNTRISYLVGARWEATALTTGSARLGYQEQDFDLAGKPDQTASIWEVGVTWSPRTYSRFSLNTSRSLEDGDEGALAIRKSVYGIRWDHEWNRGWTSSAGFSESRDKYDTGREDTIRRFDAGVTYGLRRWMDVGFRYDYEDSDSTLDSETWDRNRYMVLLNLSL